MGEGEEYKNLVVNDGVSDAVDASTYDFIHPDINDDSDNTDQLGLKEQRYLLENRGYKQDMKHRDKLVEWVIGLVSFWVLIVVMIVIKTDLSDAVIITLLSTTTINILGLPYIILKGLFGDKDKKNSVPPT